jgi:hypothetical protein
LFLGFSMRELCFVAACIHGATIGLLHHAIARRFGGVAWVVSAIAAGLSVHMTSYPIIWNPTWFVLPLTIAFSARSRSRVGAACGAAFARRRRIRDRLGVPPLFGPFVAVAPSLRS